MWWSPKSDAFQPPKEWNAIGTGFGTLMPTMPTWIWCANSGSVANLIPRVGLGYDGWKQGGRDSTMIEFKGSHFERDVILWGVRWYVAYPISYRQLEEMMEERGRGRPFDAQSLGHQICARAGPSVPFPQAAGRVQLAAG
jgi:hypothetical protein